VSVSTSSGRQEKAVEQVNANRSSSFLRAAPPTSLTAWVPIGDISPVSGGLLYLEKSVDIGLEIEDGFTKQNGDLPLEERLSAFNVNMVMAGFLSPDAAHFASAHGRRWLVSDYKAGDVVFHHPCMIHCSANNNDPEGRIRLATDLRFADKAAPHDERWANSYCQ
jgi:phytanoyl-CoA hydroxylase